MTWTLYEFRAGLPETFCLTPQRKPSMGPAGRKAASVCEAIDGENGVLGLIGQSKPAPLVPISSRGPKTGFMIGAPQGNSRQEAALDWADLGLRLIRAAGAIASALAGIAALLTDGAFQKRDKPLEGWLSSSPLARYSVTGWGATLLAIILIAPAVQFVGDWLKDRNDADAQTKTANGITQVVRESTTAERADLTSEVKQSTQKARDEIVGIVADASRRQLAELDESLHEQRRSLEPVRFEDLRLSFTAQFPLSAHPLAPYVARLQKTFDEWNVNVRDEHRNIYHYDNDAIQFVPLHAERNIFRPGFALKPGTELWPKENGAERDAARFLGDVLFYLLISETEGTPSSHDPSQRMLVLSGETQFQFPDKSGHLSDCCVLEFRPLERILVFRADGIPLHVERRRPPAFLSKLDYENKPIAIAFSQYLPGAKYSDIDLGFGKLGSLHITTGKILSGPHHPAIGNGIDLDGSTGVSDYRLGVSNSAAPTGTTPGASH